MSDPGGGRTAFVLLAAGEASRMGSAKQLLDFHGQPLVRHAALTALESGCSPVVVVLGAHEAEVRTALADLPVDLVVNPRWAHGIGTSIRAGIERVSQVSGVRGVVLGLADQPFVASSFFRTLAAGLEHPGTSIVASAYAGTVGVPAAFSPSVFSDLMALEPDQGCKRILTSRCDGIESRDCPDAAIDIDSPLDYQRCVGVEPEAGESRRSTPTRAAGS